MINRWLLLVGALQGWALWGLWKARELKVWPSIDPVSERALLYVSLALPLAFYFTQNIAELARSRRIRMMLGNGVMIEVTGDNVNMDGVRAAMAALDVKGLAGL